MSTALYVDILQTITSAMPATPSMPAVPDRHGIQRLCLRVIWDGKRIVFQGRRGYRGLDRIIGRWGKHYTPKDGLSYLRALQYHFNGGYVNATKPMPLKTVKGRM